MRPTHKLLACLRAHADMRLLLDTHIVLWALTDDKRLSAMARELIADQDNSVLVSSASIWEIAIKHAVRRNTLPFSGADAASYCTQAGYRLIDIRHAHAAAVESLPALHNDPFDRMLIAQAMTEPLRLVTHDRAVAAYDKSILLV